jgi:hypothetical protein
MSNTHTTEIPFLEAIASMTDAELATYRRRYATATDSISLIHGNAIIAEMGRRAKAALAPQPTAAEMIPAQGTWSTPAEDYAHGVAIRAILNTEQFTDDMVASVRAAAVARSLNLAGGAR